ncbi:DUF7718 family protein [Halorussus ruber]
MQALVTGALQACRTKVAMSCQSIDLGSYRGRQYQLRYRGDPTLTEPDDFAVVVLFVNPRTGDHVEVVRIDNSDGFTHMDCLYRRDEPKRELDLGMWEAVEKLTDEWRSYAEEHLKVHG